MRVLITGGAGFIGSKLAQRLLERGTLLDRPITALTLFDVVAADGPADPRVTVAAGDIADAATVERVAAPGCDVVFHLAAVVSAAAEADYDLGMRVNLTGTLNVLAAARRLGTRPTLVFASSCAVYGGALPETVTDSTPLTPQTSYGTQKAAGELLVNDAGRKGFVDARSLRLPTIVVRPNKAASTFASSIVREPLKGEAAICPVPPETAMYVLSPRKVVDAFVRAAELPAEALGTDRTLLLPGMTMTVGGTIAALARIAGATVTARIRIEPDPLIERIVLGWPARFDARRAPALGFEADESIDAIIRQHIEDEVGGSWVR
jgi:nucleoside-diphosphate-sugar epimerase